MGCVRTQYDEKENDKKEEIDNCVEVKYVFPVIIKFDYTLCNDFCWIRFEKASCN